MQRARVQIENTVERAKLRKINPVRLADHILQIVRKNVVDPGIEPRVETIVIQMEGVQGRAHPEIGEVAEEKGENISLHGKLTIFSNYFWHPSSVFF